MVAYRAVALPEQDTYGTLLDAVLASDTLVWGGVPGAHGAYKHVYSSSTSPRGEGQGLRGNRGEGGRSSAAAHVQIGLLPRVMNWKSYWPRNDDAVVVHLHGPKCRDGIMPYLKDGTVNAARPDFTPMLELCAGRANAGGCEAVCGVFDELSRGA